MVRCWDGGMMALWHDDIVAKWHSCFVARCHSWHSWHGARMTTYDYSVSGRFESKDNEVDIKGGKNIAIRMIFIGVL